MNHKEPLIRNLQFWIKHKTFLTLVKILKMWLAYAYHQRENSYILLAYLSKSWICFCLLKLFTIEHSKDSSLKASYLLQYYSFQKKMSSAKFIFSNILSYKQRISNGLSSFIFPIYKPKSSFLCIRVIQFLSYLQPLSEFPLKNNFFYAL